MHVPWMKGSVVVEAENKGSLDTTGMIVKQGMHAIALLGNEIWVVSESSRFRATIFWGK